MKDNQGPSAPKRYAVDTDAVMGLADHVVLEPAPDGEWVSWENYKRLEKCWRSVPDELLGIWASYAPEHLNRALRAEIKREIARRQGNT